METIVRLKSGLPINLKRIIEKLWIVDMWIA